MNEQESNNNWYAVYTNPRAEKSLQKLLTKYKVESYLPLLRIRKKWSDRWKYVDQPLFSSYVFVKINFWKDKNQVLQLPGSHHFIFLKGEPAVIPEEDLDLIRFFLTEFPDQVKTQMEENLQKGKKVFIKHGIFAGRWVEVEKRKSSVAVLVKMPMMNQVASVEISIDDLGFEELPTV